MSRITFSCKVCALGNLYPTILHEAYLNSFPLIEPLCVCSTCPQAIKMDSDVNQPLTDIALPTTVNLPTASRGPLPLTTPE